MPHLVLILSNEDPDNPPKQVEVCVNPDGRSALAVRPDRPVNAAKSMYASGSFLLISEKCGSWSEMPQRDYWWEIDRKLVDPSGAGLTGGLANAVLAEPEHDKVRSKRTHSAQAS